MTITQTTRSDQSRGDVPTTLVAAGSDHRLDHHHVDTQALPVEPVTTPPQAKQEASPITAAPAGSTSDSGHPSGDAHGRNAVVGTTFPADHRQSGPQRACVGGEQDRSGSGANDLTPTTARTLSDPFLALAADVLDDAERTRIANENRLRQLTRSETDSDGEERGFGLDETHPDVARLAALVAMLRQIEHQAGLNLNRLLRQHPLGPWVKAQKGIGEKQAARLLAVIGDPYVNEQTGEVRTVSQLWAYCGHGDPTRRKFKGMTQADLFRLGNPTAKSRLWLIACAVLKAQGPLVAAYYDRKAKTEGRLHAVPCVRCGPSGKPAAEGSPWSDAHRHADALRVLGKTILRGLWLEAKRIHEGTDR